MKNTMRKTFAILLTLVMLVNIFPVSAFADPEIITYEGGADPVNLPRLRAVPEGSNVIVTVSAADIDLSADGSRYYIVVGSNDSIAPYQWMELDAASPAGEYGFTVNRLSEVETVFVLLKRYTAGETPDPGALDSHEIVFNWNQSNALTIGEDDYDFTWKDNGGYNYTLGITKENSGSGGGNGSDPTNGYTAVVKTGKGVNLSKAYAIFSITKVVDLNQYEHPELTGYVAVPLPEGSTGSSVSVTSGTEFKNIDRNIKVPYAEGDEVTVILAVGGSGEIQNHQIPNGYGTPIKCTGDDRDTTYNGKNVYVDNHPDQSIIYIQIGDMPAYDAEISFTEGGETVTPNLTDRYYILAGVEADSYDFYAQINADGTVGAFSGNGVVEGGKLPAIKSLQIIKYTGNSQNPTLSDLLGGDTTMIADGDTMGEYTVTYPPTLEPEGDTLQFTASSPGRYDFSLTFCESNGTQQQGSAELNGSYYIVAMENGQPVAYAAVPNYPTQNDLVFKDSSGNEGRLTSDSLTFEIRKPVNGGPLSFSEVVESPAPSTLGKYVLDGRYDSDSNKYIYTATKNPEKYVRVDYYLNGGDERDPAPEVSGRFYMVASVNSQSPQYYAEVNTNGSNHSFSNGVDSFNGLPDGADIRLVEYTGTSENPTLDELKELPEAVKLSKYEWKPDDTVTDGYVFKAIASNDLYVRVSTYEADNTTPLVPEDAITGQYYVRVPVREAPVTETNPNPQIVAYCMAPFEFDPDAAYTDVKLTKFVNKDNSAFDEGAAAVSISSLFIDYENVRVVRLLNEGSKPSTYEQACDKTNYVDDTAPEGWAFTGKDTTGDGCNVHMKRAEKTPRYFVRLKFDTTDPTEISLDGGAWLKVTVDHQSGPDTYGFIELSNAEHKKSKYLTVDQENGCTYIDIPVTEWKNADGTNAAGEHFTGNEQGISVVLAAGPHNATPNTVSNIPEHDYINSSEISAYPTGTADDHLVNESDNYIDVYDVVTLHQNDDKFTGYTLEEILNGYNIVAICPNKVVSPSNSGASAFGDGDFMMEQHQMGGVLIRGDVIYIKGTGVADSPSITKPSVVGGYVPPFTDSFFNNRQNNNNGWNSYIGSVNTVAGDHYVNNHAVAGRGYTGTNTGVTVVDDNYVDWDRLQSMVINTSNALGSNATSTGVSYDSDNNKYTIQAGANALINYPEKTVVTINIEVRDEQGNLVDFQNATGYDANGNLITYKDYSNIPGTVVSNLGTGTYYPPKVQINGIPLDATVEDGNGISLLWNYPNAGEVYVPASVTPQFGHVVAPKAYINAPEGGNNSGCLVGNKVRSSLEGHLYPYKGATLIGFYGDLGMEKTVNGGKPAERQKYDFILEKLTPNLTNSEYTERMAKLSGDDKEQRVFWQRLQTARNEEDPNHEDKDFISFNDISFDSAGTFYFRVYENQATVTNTILDARQFLIECKVGSYTTDNGRKTELRMSSIKYYEIDTSKQLLNISSSSHNKNASLNIAAIGAAHTLSWDQGSQNCDTGITFDNTVTAASYYVTLEGTKHLEGRILRDHEFHFTVTDITDPEHRAKAATGTNIADGDTDNEIHFTQITYKAEDFASDEPGPVTKVFVYEITEDRPAEATSENNYTYENITYDPGVITATVTVTYNPDADVNNGEQFFTHTATYDPADGTFRNSYTATAETDLKAAKSMSGRRNEFKAGDAWTFTVTAEEITEEPGSTAIPLPVRNGEPCTSVAVTPAAGDSVADIDFGTITFTRDDVGRTYRYTIRETGEVAGVTNDSEKTVEITVIGNDDGTISITRTPGNQVISFVNFDEGSTEIAVEKKWVNSNGDPIDRTSGSATVQLIAVRSEIEPTTPPQPTEADLDVNVSWTDNRIPSDAVITVTTGGKTITLNNGNSYRGKFEDLTIGETYTLTVTKTAGDGTVVETETVTAGPIADGPNTATISATYTPPSTERKLTVFIQWVGGNEPGDNVNITAVVNGQNDKSVVLNSGNNWTGVITGLEIGTNCSVQLTVPDSGVGITQNPLSTTINDTESNELMFIGTFTGEQPEPATQNLKVKIDWTGNPENVSIPFTVTGSNGAVVFSGSLDNLPWEGTVPGLDNGGQYTVSLGTITGANAGNVTISNPSPQTITLSSANHVVTFYATYTEQQQPETADLTVSINWDNRPNDLYLQVSAGDGLTAQLDQNNNWTATFSNLTVGQTYTVTAGNKWGNDANNANITDSPRTIQITSGTNTVSFNGTYTQQQQTETGSLYVNLNWNNNNPPPADSGVTVRVSIGGKYIDLGNGNWSGTITDIPVGSYNVTAEVTSGSDKAVISQNVQNGIWINNGQQTNISFNGTYTSASSNENKLTVCVDESWTNNNWAITGINGGNGLIYSETLNKDKTSCQSQGNLVPGTEYSIAIQYGNAQSIEASVTGNSGEALCSNNPWNPGFGEYRVTFVAGSGPVIITLSIEGTGISGKNYYSAPIRFIASTGWTDVSFGKISPSDDLKAKIQQIIGQVNEEDYKLVGDPVTLQYNADDEDESWKHLWEDLAEYYKDESTGKEYNISYYVIETTARAARQRWKQ